MKKIILTTVIVLFSINAVAQHVSLFNNDYSEQRKMTYVMGAIENMYVDTVNMHKLVENSIVNMLKELDPHSAYIPEEELQRANESLEGSFEGIGIQFQMLEDTLFVIQTISGCPAERVGVRAGDRIIKVEEETIAGVKMKNSEIMKRLRGPKGSIVHVNILREQELIEFAISRDKIPIYSMDAAYMAAPEIGYIKINNFGATTHDEFLEGLHKLQKQGAKSLILDLQGNGGGYLNAAIDLADEFLLSNQLVVYTQGEHQSKNIATATANGDFESGKLIVLVDEYSASASEIVSGAIQDWDRGLIVGRRTFGKGLVQRQMMLPDGSAIRLTTARYYTPSGRCIQKPYKGVDYQKELELRYKHGELMHADSIHFPDSLKYATLSKGRTVYGGGGIMPDVFIPADTTRYTSYHRKIVAKGLINKCCVQYIDKNRKELTHKYPTFKKYQDTFTVPDKMLEELIANAEKEKIPFDEEQYKKSETLIRLQIKALIARDLWSMQEYFELINKQDEPLIKAIQILQSGTEYEQYLNTKRK